MKNKSFKLFLFLVLIILVTSCRKENDKGASNYKEEVKNSILGSGSTNGYDGVISYSALCLREVNKNGILSQQVVYDAEGQFFQNLTSLTTVDVGTLSIGNINLNTNVTQYGNYSYRFNNADRNNSNNMIQFGSNTTFNISGNNGYGFASTNFYVPEEIFLDTIRSSCPNSYPVIKISNLPYRIFWNADPSNINGVVVMVGYNEFLSRLINSSFSNTPFYNTPVSTPDIGYYDITANDLVNIPIGGVIDLYVGRGSQGAMQTNGKSIKVEAEAHALRRYIVTQ